MTAAKKTSQQKSHSSSTAHSSHTQAPKKQPSSRHTTHMRSKKFHEPKPSATPRDRRRLALLGFFAGVTIILLWYLTLPWNLANRGKTAPGPRDLIDSITGPIANSERLGPAWDQAFGGVQQEPVTENDN